MHHLLRARNIREHKALEKKALRAHGQIRAASRKRARAIGGRLERLRKREYPATNFARGRRTPAQEESAATRAMYGDLTAKDPAFDSAAKNEARKMVRFARLVEQFPALEKLDASWSDIRNTLSRLEAGGELHSLVRAWGV